MTLESVKTVDGGPLAAGHTYYTLALDIPAGRFHVVECKPMRIAGNSIHAEIPAQKREANYPIINGQAFGVWYDREVLEAGLGKGAQ